MGRLSTLGFAQQTPRKQSSRPFTGQGNVPLIGLLWRNLSDSITAHLLSRKFYNLMFNIILSEKKSRVFFTQVSSRWKLVQTASYLNGLGQGLSPYLSKTLAVIN